MRIGFTYDLKDDYIAEGFSEEAVSEFDSLITIDAVAGAIAGSGHDVDRIGNYRVLMSRLLKGERWDLVFNICEGMFGSARESLVPALLDEYKIPYAFSSPSVHAVALNKALTKRLLRDFGLPVTDFSVASSETNITEPADYPLFVKAVAEGTGKGITPGSIVKNRAELTGRVKELTERFRQPAIIEPYLSGREVTVGVIGTGEDAFVLGVMNIEITEKGDSPIHSYYNKINCDLCARYTLSEGAFADRCADMALEAHRKLDIRDASRADIRCDGSGTPFIMEINSLPGLMPSHSDLIILGELAGYSHRRIVEKMLESALRRKNANSHML